MQIMQSFRRRIAKLQANRTALETNGTTQRFCLLREASIFQVETGAVCTRDNSPLGILLGSGRRLGLLCDFAYDVDAPTVIL